MTMGYLCDYPECNTFTPRSQVASYEHKCTTVDDMGEVKVTMINAHFCESCAIDFTTKLWLLPVPEAYGE